MTTEESQEARPQEFVRRILWIGSQPIQSWFLIILPKDHLMRHGSKILEIKRVTGSQTITQGGIFFYIVGIIIPSSKNCSKHVPKNHQSVISF
jgi:hypothetical protein